MSPVTIVLLVILAVLIIGLIVLYSGSRYDCPVLSRKESTEKES